MEKLDSLQLSSDKTAKEVEKAAFNTDKIAQCMGEFGEERRKYLKLLTPAARKMVTLKEEWILVAPEMLFRVVGDYRSLPAQVS